VSRDLGRIGVSEQRSDRIEKVATLRLEPMDARVTPEPRLLASRQGAKPAKRLGLGLLEGYALFDVAEQLAVTDRLTGGSRQPSWPRG
jgi:hypothetical protein